MSATDTSTQQPGNLMHGLMAMWAAVACFSLMDAIAKWQGGEGFAIVQIMFLRYLFGLVPVLVALWFFGFDKLRTDRPLAHTVRALLMSGALAMFFWGLQHVALAEAIAVAFAAPLFITALSVPMLGERVGIVRWAAVVAGFIGMLIIIRPGTDAFKPEMGLIVVSTVLFAFGQTYTRLLSRTEAAATIFSWTTIISLMVYAPLGLWFWQVPGADNLAGFATMGLIGGTAHFLVIIAYRNAPAAVVAPQEYTGLIWGALLGWVIWSEVPSVYTWVGAVIVAAAGGFIAWRETRIQARNKMAATE